MSKYKGKKVLIVGFGLSGVAAAKFFARQGAVVTVTDMKQRTELMDSLKEVGDLKIEYDLGKHTPKYFHEAELIVLSPGVPMNIKPLEEARGMGVPVTTEVEVAAQQLKEPLIGITGTNGKTTCTTLVGEMFKADGKPAFVGGNIGNPLLNYINDKGKVDCVVAELSSFQLELIEKLVPAAAAFLNIEPDHMDRYPSFEAYLMAKKRLLDVCDRNSYVVLNYDDPHLMKWGSQTPGRVLWFTKRNPLSVGGEFAENFNGAYLAEDGSKITVRLFGREEVYDLAKFRLFGDHNKENLMAAMLLARVQGVSEKAINKVIEAFPGVAHRIEFIRKKDGVYFFNDSKATNVMSVQRSLASFKRSPIILIMGGKDKDADFSSLVDPVRKKCKMLILVGQAKEKINRVLGDATETYLVGTFEEAVLMAYQKSRGGDIILLSPGCASFDMFRNYEERGEYFKKLVHQL